MESASARSIGLLGRRGAGKVPCAVRLKDRAADIGNNGIRLCQIRAAPCGYGCGSGLLLGRASRCPCILLAKEVQAAPNNRSCRGRSAMRASRRPRPERPLMWLLRLLKKLMSLCSCRRFFLNGFALAFDTLTTGHQAMRMITSFARMKVSPLLKRSSIS